MADLIAELAEVVRLGIAASNDEPWQVDAEGDIVCNGEQVAWPITNKLDAPYIAALNNWFRTHHAEIEAMARDAARWNHCVSAGRFPVVCQDGESWMAWRSVSPTSNVRGHSPSGAIDQAMHNSAREVGE